MKLLYITLISFFLFATSCKDKTTATEPAKATINNSTTDADPSSFKNLQDVQKAFEKARNGVNQEITDIYNEIQTTEGAAKYELERRKMRLEQIRNKIDQKMLTLEAESEKDLNRFIAKSKQWLFDLNQRLR